MTLRFLVKEHVSIEQVDNDNCIISIKCPSFLAADILCLIDSLAYMTRIAATQCRISRTSFINKKALNVA